VLYCFWSLSQSKKKNRNKIEEVKRVLESLKKIPGNINGSLDILKQDILNDRRNLIEKSMDQ
jgi:hypothetical protein